MTEELGDKTPAGMGQAHLAGSVDPVAHQAHPATPATHHILNEV